MKANGGSSTATRAASCAFMGRLDLLTTAIYPHDPLQDSDEEGAPPPPFALYSSAAVLPALAGVARLSMHVLRPYLVVGLFVLGGLGVASTFCITTGAALLAYLCLFDERFRRSEPASQLAPGVHCRRSPRAEAIMAIVPAFQHPYYKGTPWIIGGDMATLYPFLAFRLPVVRYARRWLSVDADSTYKNGGNTRKGGGGNGNGHGKDNGKDNGSNRQGNSSDSSSLDGSTDCGGSSSAAVDASAASDGSGRGEGGGAGMDADDREAVALDIALPEKGLDPAKPFYIVLHGLTGGSSEAYVLDFVTHALERDCGVCVMITRGCMGTPVRGNNIFHGARISDARSTVRALRRSLPEETPLVMLGYSMGGIIAMNYAAISGENSGLSCCVSMSGSFDTRQGKGTNMGSRHSQRVWQPILAWSLKENFVVNNTRKMAARGLDVSAIESCRHVLDIDTHFVSRYNGYSDVTGYYVDMSAAAEDKIAGLRIPMLAVSSFDDPIMTSDGSPEAALTNVEDLFILVTRKGGHVGWPTGWLPHRNKWSWMSNTSLDFCEAVVATAAL
ncbi:unnamed protein product [Pylaiella littoralis]